MKECSICENKIIKNNKKFCKELNCFCDEVNNCKNFIETKKFCNRCKNTNCFLAKKVGACEKNNVLNKD